QAGQTRSGGDSASGNQSLSDLENDLRSGAMNGTSGSQGAGNGEGGDPLSGAPHRLSVDARVVQVEAEEREGPTQWPPPSPTATRSRPAGFGLQTFEFGLRTSDLVERITS